MLDDSTPDLRIYSIPTGSHGATVDLRELLYRGTCKERRGEGLTDRIRDGEFGAPRVERLELLVKVHDHIEGSSTSSTTKLSLLQDFRAFLAWAEEHEKGHCISEATAKDLYVAWADNLIHRVRVIKDLKQSGAYSLALRVANVLGPVLNPDSPQSSKALVQLSGIRRPKSQVRSISSNVDKQRLDHTFQFGHFLASLCNSITVELVRGPLPLSISVVEGSDPLFLCSQKFTLALDPDQLPTSYRQQKAMRSRSALPPDGDPRNHKTRAAAVNARISAELHIFLAQTGMNLTQAKAEPRAEYRWQTEGDEDYIVRAVYKGRRQGVAKFVVFRAYRDHLKRYLDWLDALGLNDGDDRLFPFVHQSIIPAHHRRKNFETIRKYCAQFNVPYVTPRRLRKARVNWLLRRSRDPDLTAEMNAHTKETCLRVYAEGDLQSASQEIGEYHAKTDPALTKAPRTNPVCLKGDEGPRPLQDTPKEAPQPDCVTPEGCLWCEHFRDVMAPDYCWRLASHRHIHSLAASLYRPPESQPLLPSYLVLERLSAKLKAIAARSVVCAEWVKEAGERVREGDYHPFWAARIKIVESFR